MRSTHGETAKANKWVYAWDVRENSGGMTCPEKTEGQGKLKKVDQGGRYKDESDLSLESCVKHLPVMERQWRSFHRGVTLYDMYR